MPRETDPWFVYKLAAFVSLGALLFGYDQGVMGMIVADQRWKDLMQPANSCMFVHRRVLVLVLIWQGSPVLWCPCMTSAASLVPCPLVHWPIYMAARDYLPWLVLSVLSAL